MKTLKEARDFVRDQFEGNDGFTLRDSEEFEEWYKAKSTGTAINKKDKKNKCRTHYGRCELVELLNFIYGEENG